ncbi:MAG: MMPL family transporter [Proteobacteria bacterium]|nr:MMPL family transporter [Pseudomonadota bacterium]
MFDRLATLVLGHRAAVAAALTVLVLGVASGAHRLQADFSAVAFYGAGDHEVDHLLDYKRRWGHDDSMLLVLVEAPDGLLTPARMNIIAAMTEDLDRHPDVAEVVSIATTPALVGETPSSIDLTGVAEAMPTAPGLEFDRWKQRVLDHPVAVPFLLSEDGTTAAVAVTMDVDADDIQKLRPIVETLRGVVTPYDGREGMTLTTAGIPAVRTDFFKLIFEDQIIAVALISIVISLLLLLLFRRLHGLLAPGFAAAVPALMVFGVMGWTGETIGILNQSYFTLLPCIAIADAIHMVSRFHEEARRRADPGERLSPEQRHDAIAAAVRSIGVACLLTSTTTGVGFLSLQMAGMPILRGFGLYAGIGIAFAYGTVLLITPLALSFTRGAVPEASREGAHTLADRLLLRCAEFSIQRPGVVLAATAGVLLASGWFGAQVVVDNTLTGMLDESHPTTQANVLADEKLGGILGLELDLVGPPGSMKDPKVLLALEALDAWAFEQPDYRTSTGPHRFASAFKQSLSGINAIPQDSDEIAQLFLLGEGAGLETVVDPSDFCCGRATLRIKDHGGLATERHSEAVKAKAAELFADLPVEARLTGTPYVAYRGINRVTSDLRDSLIVAFLIITGTILLLFRNARIAALCLVPNALPLAAGYGLMGALGWLLDPVPAVVFTIGLGIAVDDTIHLVARWREERRSGRGPEEAIRQSVLHTGRAVTITSVVLAAGFSVNLLSSFPATRIMGMLGAFVILTALLCDLFVLPALLARFGGTREP